jgi:hypothetical protein
MDGGVEEDADEVNVLPRRPQRVKRRRHHQDPGGKSEPDGGDDECQQSLDGEGEDGERGDRPDEGRLMLAAEDLDHEIGASAPQGHDAHLDRSTFGP